MIKTGSTVLVAHEDPKMVGEGETSYQGLFGEVLHVERDMQIRLNVTVRFDNGEVNHFGMDELEVVE